MTTVALPAGFMPRSCTLTLRANQRVYASPFGGSEQVIDLLNDRWMLSCELPPSRMASGAAIEAFIGAMRGQVNVCALYHFARPAPRGTARGTITTNGTTAQGASSVVLAGISPTGGTLLAGDMLGIGSQLFMVAADVTASGGAATVTITGRVRTAITTGTSVVWDKPTLLFRLLQTAGVTYNPRFASGASFDFGEAI